MPKKKRGLFGRGGKSSSSNNNNDDYEDDYDEDASASASASAYSMTPSRDGNASMTSSVSGSNNNNGHRSKRKGRRGIGRKLKRLVKGGVGRKGKKKRKGENGNGDDDDIEVYDPSDPNYKGPRTALDADVLARVLSKDGGGADGANGKDGGYVAAGRFGSLDGVEEGDEDEDDEESDSDKENMLYGGKDSEDDDEDDRSEQGELVGPLDLVLVLVDPRSLRFELLELEFETPQLSKVNEGLEQIKDIVTESAIKGLEFHSVLDRKGNSFIAKMPLGKALKCRRRGKDILVAIPKGVTPEEAGRLARPILGDPKVIDMFETNGYSVKGWAKNPKEHSVLRDTHKESFAATERKRQLRTMIISLTVICLAYIIYQVYLYFLVGAEGNNSIDPATIGQSLMHGTPDIVPETTASAKSFVKQYATMTADAAMDTADKIKTAAAAAVAAGEEKDDIHVIDLDTAASQL